MNKIDDAFEYCEKCKDPLGDEDDVYEGLCNHCGDEESIGVASQ